MCVWGGGGGGGGGGGALDQPARRGRGGAVWWDLVYGLSIRMCRQKCAAFYVVLTKGPVF